MHHLISPCLKYLQAFPGAAFKFADESGEPLTPEQVSPPFRLSFAEPPSAAGSEAKKAKASVSLGPLRWLNDPVVCAPCCVPTDAAVLYLENHMYVGVRAIVM